jgi:hypothetical protein
MEIVAGIIMMMTSLPQPHLHERASSIFAAHVRLTSGGRRRRRGWRLAVAVWRG